MSVKRWYASIDWVTITAPTGDLEDFPTWCRLMEEAIEQAGGNSKVVKGRNDWGEYQGKKYASGAFVGRHNVNGLIMSTGGQAAHNLVRDLPFEPQGVTRLDIQATFWLSEDDEGVAQRACDEHNSKRSPNDRQSLPVLIKGHGNGDTLRIGQTGKGATTQTQIYDKYRKSGKKERDERWKNAWRYEVRLTGKYAEAALEKLQENGLSESDIAAMVRGKVGSRYITMPITDGAEPLDAGLAPRPKSDADKKMRWLSTVVVSVLKWLKKEGFTKDDLIEVLFGWWDDD